MPLRKWYKIARQQFEEMPSSFQDDWLELRRAVYRE
jgi:hypothetical protein